MEDSVRRDLASLVDRATSFAAQMLLENGEFHAFGNLINSDGAFEIAGVYTGDEPTSGEEIRELTMKFMRSRANQRTLRACAVCADVRLKSPEGRATDAINVFLEHQQGEARTVLKPYFKGVDGGFYFEPLILLLDGPTIFAGSKGEPGGAEGGPRRRSLFGRFGRG